MRMDILSAVLAFVIVIFSFIIGIGIWWGLILCISSPFIVNGTYILVKGRNTWLILQCGVHPQKLGYVYKGNGRWEHPVTGDWVQYNDNNVNF